ncbi:hypothetical protein QIS74_08171 [Colletotrichum tabaci]|uniref:LysM domain-containing protein n=1 Tax=Colletotrichum tabaci TaxID=1209068 RepID=A0AAV9T9M8_9PEZI
MGILDFRLVMLLLPVALASQSEVQTRATTGGCEAYSVQIGDTCASIARSVNATYAQIISWNSEIDLACSNLAEVKGSEICVSNPLGNYALPSNSQGVPTIVTTAAPVPAPTPDKTNDHCGEYHLVEPGEDCSIFIFKFTITLKDFLDMRSLFLNPQVWENCTNVWADYYYCVRPVGYISTYPGYLPPTTTKEFIQTPTTDLPYVEDLFAKYTSTEPIINVANGTRLDCYDYVWLDTIADSILADCWAMTLVYDVPQEDFILWNPSLRENPEEFPKSYGYPCTLSASSSYCAALASPTAAPTSTPAPPSPRAAGEIANCTTWYSPESGDSCAVVLDRTSLTLDEFFTFNPSVKGDCSSMVTGTYYCVSTQGDGSPPGAHDDQPPPSTTTGTSSPTGIATPSPVQPEMVSNCNKFYEVISGDGCWAIADANGVPLEDFYSWNPAVKTDCTGLQADVYVCVGVSATQIPPTTTAAGDASPATPKPTQEGMVNGCGDFYKVQSGDGCWAIADANGVPLEDFYSWNPAVKTDCTGLQADVYVCVGLTVAGTTQPTAAATTTAANE